MPSPIRCFWHNVGLQCRISRGHISRRQAEFFAHDVCALRNSDSFKEGNVTVTTLPPETAIAGNNQLLRGNVFQRLTNRISHLLRRFNLQRAMRQIADAVDDLPAECRDLAGNALLNVAAEAVAEDVGCTEASRIFARLADILARGLQPPVDDAISLTAFDA